MLFLILALAMPIDTKEEFDKLTLVDKSEERTEVFKKHSFITMDLGTIYRAKTKYGNYSRFNNLIMANMPDGSIGYFAYDKKTGKSMDIMNVDEFMDFKTEDIDKRLKVPSSCINCHKDKFKP